MMEASNLPRFFNLTFLLWAAECAVQLIEILAKAKQIILSKEYSVIQAINQAPTVNSKSVISMDHMGSLNISTYL
jgi:hypothetical protein